MVSHHKKRPRIIAQYNAFSISNREKRRHLGWVGFLLVSNTDAQSTYTLHPVLLLACSDSKKNAAPAAPHLGAVPLALIDIDGKDEASLREAVEEALGEAMEAGDVLDAVIAQSQTQAKMLWKLREAPAELNTQMHPPVNFDVSLPQAEIGRFAEFHATEFRLLARPRYVAKANLSLLTPLMIGALTGEGGTPVTMIAVPSERPMPSRCGCCSMTGMMSSQRMRALMC